MSEMRTTRPCGSYYIVDEQIGDLGNFINCAGDPQLDRQGWYSRWKQVRLIRRVLRCRAVYS